MLFEYVAKNSSSHRCHNSTKRLYKAFILETYVLWSVQTSQYWYAAKASKCYVHVCIKLQLQLNKNYSIPKGGKFLNENHWVRNGMISNLLLPTIIRTENIFWWDKHDHTVPLLYCSSDVFIWTAFIWKNDRFHVRSSILLVPTSFSKIVLINNIFTFKLTVFC